MKNDASGRKPLPTKMLHSFAEFQAYAAGMHDEYHRRRDAELASISSGNTFQTSGYCYVCGALSTFETDYQYADGDEYKGVKMPNWRERVICTSCGLNNRIRGCIHFLEQNLGCHKDAAIYISEQSTPLYKYLRKHYSQVVGSEYFGNQLPYGATDPVTGYRNESVTRLTFADAALDYILSFEVFEHVPDYDTALREAARCLKPGGKLFFTVPFNMNFPATEVRARLDPAGNIEHLVQPPVYHGDPINKSGILCFYTFGWDLLERLKAAGFRTAQLHLYWNQEYAYPGHQVLLTAER